MSAFVALTRIAKFRKPTAMAVRAGDDALYVAEQMGRIWAVRHGVVDSEPAHPAAAA